MAPISKQARGLASLNRKIQDLEQKSKQLEQNIDDNFNYFQQHSGSILVNSLFPRKTDEQMHAEGFSLGGIVLYTLLQNEQVRKNLGKLTNGLAEKLGSGFNKLMDKILKEKQA